GRLARAGTARSAARRGGGSAVADGAAGRRQRGTYLTCSAIHSTVAFICSSVSDGLPPRAGITPVLPVKPSIACLSRVSMPAARRGAQAPRSVIFGAPATPASWQLLHRWL